MTAEGGERINFMVLNSKETAVAYRCPKCGKMVRGMVGVFSLSGDLIKLKCECGESELEMVKTNDKKVRITVPCLVCGGTHGFVLSLGAFFDSEIFAYTCPYSGIELCLIGKSDALDEAAAAADETLIKILKEAGVENVESFITAREADDEAENGKVPDPEMQSVVHFLLCELEDEGNISCKCGRHGRYEFKFVGANLDTVLIYCTECSASVSIPLPDAIAANAFLHTEKLTLN